MNRYNVTNILKHLLDDIEGCHSPLCGACQATSRKIAELATELGLPADSIMPTHLRRSHDFTIVNADDCDLMTIAEFIDCISSRCIIDSDDGHGYYAVIKNTVILRTNQQVPFSIADLTAIGLAGVLTHVVWYNK